VPLETPTPDGVLELFRDEIVFRPAEIDREYADLADGRIEAEWQHPFPGVEILPRPDGPTLMRVTFKRLIDGGGFDEGDRIRHELRELWNDIRASISSNAQVEFVGPRLSHVDHPEGLEVICYTHGIVRGG
jgi:hypothetical protein